MEKDWKKIKTYSKHFVGRWQRKKSTYPRRNEYIQVEKHGEKDISVWHTTNPFGSGGVHEELKNFKTKSQALAFAKAYMRKH